MQKVKIRAPLFVVVLLMATMVEADIDELPESIIAITSNAIPIQRSHWNSASSLQTRPRITILNLDAVQSIEDELSEGLPKDEVLARALVQQRIDRVGLSALEDEIRSAYLPLSTMITYGLNRYPVIIFDKQVVVYGVTDLSLAINRYRHWLMDEQERNRQ